MASPSRFEVTIPAGQAVSDWVKCIPDHRTLTPVAIEMPDAWTQAALSFDVAPMKEFDEAGRPVPPTVGIKVLHDFDGELVVSPMVAVPNALVSLSPIERFAIVPWIRVRSGTKAAPVAQAEARTLYIHARDFD